MGKRVLDHGLNRAIVALSPAFIARDHAPETFRDMLNNPGIVWVGASDATIYGDAFVNWCFRAWHDKLHAEHMLDFSFDGEAATCELQCRELETMFPCAPKRWRKIIEAEIIGQARHVLATGAFPIDQMTFIRQQIGEA